jgi:hypothetical protein
MSLQKEKVVAHKHRIIEYVDLLEDSPLFKEFKIG